ncbi:UDP-N-acetylglucosamine 2-epimerase (non-hydrolyzing) [Marinomonas rhizomae]|uniref:UDP-GlcNAc3NAcA epimerase n=1 Tax=Marinomonas rhizomae TaxID=491948 RepID=A0A366JA79_9GAMM|nr:UDP-N-acetylglucosamine 2-epimerase (non-hydrolyzing) [Marinomonas rhizomae]RBP83279.1 UDP-GlcNAc3NAcA epimerase [Marinomonas rhizomae]RNF69384.1 UDP-N-acetylglucosamine 2-epimerase (non-hydrolyzing) [Marinomonas rhizomae]
MKIVTVIGARPQFIKAAVISRAIRRYDQIEEIIIHTGQHFDANMSDVFFEQMGIPKPHYQLEIASLSHGAMTGRMLEKIEEVLVKEQPDWVLVYGDTNSTLAGALAAAKLHIKVAHVEAGLRSFNMRMPEEQNRVLTDKVSKILFCPTQAAKCNLLQEGYVDNINYLPVVGDVMFDAAKFYSRHSQRPRELPSDIEIGNFILGTIHRAENTNDLSRLRSLVEALNEIHQTEPVIVPLHPRTKSILDKNGIVVDFKVLKPVGYLEMIYLLKHCSLVVSDSGGVQKEAYFFEKSCLVTRDETEWTELVEHGSNYLVGVEKDKILAAYDKSKSAKIDYSVPFYGNGYCAEEIISYLLKDGCN